MVDRPPESRLADALDPRREALSAYAAMTASLRAALEARGLGDLYPRLAAQDLDAAALDELNEADLRELGLTIGQRKRLLRARRAGTPPPEPAPEPVLPRAERRQLTTLFCDLVGSTQLATSLDPEDLRDVIEAFLTLCGDAIRAHAGHIAFAQGDGVMAYFGFPFAREDDPERAVRCAFDILERLAGLRTRAPAPLAARIGIATGLVVVGESHDRAFGEGMVVGETPNLAARLQSLAGPGEVMVGETTRRLCGGLFAYEPRGATEVKGFPAPMQVFRVLGEGAAASRFDARASSGLSPIVGRDAELERLRQAWRGALAGRGRLVLIGGEAGIGKSRLTHAFIEWVADQEPHVLRWFCAAHLTNRALHPLEQAIESMEGLARHQPAEARRAALERLVGTSPLLTPEDLPFLADLLGLPTDIRESHDAPARARRTQAALLRRLEGHAAAAPLLILLEDAHWADPATIEFVSALIERLAALPALLMITHRPEFVPPWPPGPTSERIELQALDGAAGARLVDSVVRERIIPDALVRTILEKAGGVPLFVEELTKTLLDSLGERQHAADAFAALAVPETLRDSLMARLDRLGRDKELAQTGSVIGREFTEPMLRAIAPDHPDIAGGLARLCASGLAHERLRDEVRVVTFHHALVQETAYESLLRRHRRDIHAAIARAMLAGDPAFAGVEPEVVARHCARGDMPAEAVSHFLDAGLHALDRAASAAAKNHLQAALEQLARLPDDEARLRAELRIQMALAPANMAVHGWAAPEVEVGCRRAIHLAQSVADGPMLFGATWGLWSNHFLRGETEQALEVAHALDGMAAATGVPALLCAADHAVGFTSFFRGDLDTAIARAAAGTARCDAATDREIIRMFQLSSAATFAAFAAPALWMAGRAAEAHAEHARSLAVSTARAHAPSIALSLTYGCFLPAHQRDWRRVRGMATRAAALAEAEDFRMWLPLAQMFVALCDCGAGRLETGLPAAFEAFGRFAATGTSVTQSHIHAPLGEFLIAAGRAEEAVERLTPRIESAERRAEGCYLSELYRVRGLALAFIGEPDQAAADLDRAEAIARAQGAATLLRRAEDSRRAALGTGGLCDATPSRRHAVLFGEKA